MRRDLETPDIEQGREPVDIPDIDRYCIIHAELQVITGILPDVIVSSRVIEPAWRHIHYSLLEYAFRLAVLVHRGELEPLGPRDTRQIAVHIAVKCRSEHVRKPCPCRHPYLGSYSHPRIDCRTCRRTHDVAAHGCRQFLHKHVGTGTVSCQMHRP